MLKDNVTGNAPSEFPGSAYLAFHVLWTNEVEGALSKSVGLSPDSPLQSLEEFIINMSKKVS